MPASSQSANNRISGKFQSDELRIAILDAAEQLFLEAGIENTAMGDIAARAGINRVTLYRYFANRDEVAVEIHIRMIKKMEQTTRFAPFDTHTLVDFKLRAQLMIRNFVALRDIYRYIGMFDKIYLDNASDSPLTRWTIAQLIKAGFVPPHSREGSPMEPYRHQLAVMMTSMLWFLEKLALRGEVTWSGQEFPLDEQLRIYENMVMGYFDRLIETQNSRDHASTSDIPSSDP